MDEVYECADCGWRGARHELMEVIVDDGHPIALCPQCHGATLWGDGWRKIADCMSQEGDC